MKRYTSHTISGHGRGKLLGYPTFNLLIPKDLNINHGIYACWVWLPLATHKSHTRSVMRPSERDLSTQLPPIGRAGEMTEREGEMTEERAIKMTKDNGVHPWGVLETGGERYMGAMHYGPVPVFDQPEPSLEIFVLDWEDDGQPISQLDFAVGPRLRDIMRFDSAETLAEQIGKDVTNTRKLLTTH